MRTGPSQRPASPPVPQSSFLSLALLPRTIFSRVPALPAPLHDPGPSQLQRQLRRGEHLCREQGSGRHLKSPCVFVDSLICHLYLCLRQSLIYTKCSTGTRDMRNAGLTRHTHPSVEESCVTSVHVPASLTLRLLICKAVMLEGTAPLQAV